MFRMIARTIVSRIATALIDLVVIALTSLALVELLRDIARPSHVEGKDIILDISVIMIGWGVALEERGAVREVFKLQGGTTMPGSIRSTRSAMASASCCC